MKRIGPRNIKTALAVGICILISRLLRLEYPFYAAIAAIISMESSITASLHAGKNRMLGTCVGAAIGMLCALIQPGNALLCGIGIVIVIYICHSLRWNKAVAIAGIVFLAIMLNLEGRSPVFYSLNRLLDTFIGVTVAILVNHFFMPPNHWTKTIQGGHELLHKTKELLQKLFIAGEMSNLSVYRKEISAYKRQLLAFHEDLRYLKRNAEDWGRLKETIDLFYNLLNDLQAIQELPLPLGLDDDNRGRVRALFESPALPEGPAGSGEAEIVYNYHVRQLLARYGQISRRIESAPGLR
ncbi:uncharacterized membrane protein YgaE (UPF0421/DUF939 family) [Hydrogenispora ethanolica]|uniref:Uncharacterized membrane protein YgaE (UPF0421/DUF939 family) n=1 Tax=Hydrogenispora ethanolica TaxID=1082276 RepID=A0A4R1R7D1_HYDET|nr:aromatic acid exporter family protein [Hydrogenispora ethanolica]TCL61523.1 uncharacterized membrane protein YgaE (UPF0421/DUF939 family) [Hydrogenispora ethanolica]